MQMLPQRYLERIGVSGAGLNTETLCRLQRAHYEAVPYENLDILAGKPLDLRIEALYRKIVEERRGGYCFELNGLYAWLLRALGFSLTERLGRFLKGESALPMGRHRVLLVVLGGLTYVCDVGVGCPVPTQPLVLQYETTQTVDGTEYRFVRDASLKNILQYWHHGVWEPYFSFGDDENFPCDFTAPSFFCEHSPASPFNKGPMVHLFTKDGRISLEGRQLKRFRGKDAAVTTLETAEELSHALQSCFALSVDVHQLQL